MERDNEAAAPVSVGLDDLFLSLVRPASIRPGAPRLRALDVADEKQQEHQPWSALEAQQLPSDSQSSGQREDVNDGASSARTDAAPAGAATMSPPSRPFGGDLAPPRSSSSSGGSVDMAALLATLNLRFSKLEGVISSQFASLNAKVDDLDHRLARLQQSTPPPPSYSSVASVATAPTQTMLPPPPPSFYSPHPILPPQTGARRGMMTPGAPTTPGTRVPTTSNTAVCSKCYLYYTPMDLRSHSALCVGPAPPASRAPQHPPPPAASAPPPSMSGAGEGRVVVHKGQYYWIPANSAAGNPENP